MDPSVVAMKDVERQGQADQQNAQLKLVAENNKKEAAGMKTQADLQKEGMRLQDKQADRQFKAEQAEAERQQRERDSAQSAQVAAQGNELRLQGVVETNDSREAIAGLTAQAKMDANAADNETALEITEMNIEADKAAGRLKTGTGQDPGNVAP